MGEIIRKTAAAEDIVADAKQSFVRAQARGGLYQAAAEQTLKPALALFDAVDTKWQAQEASLAPLLAAHTTCDDQADALIGRIADAVWNDVGRPAPGVDGSYDLLFPSGIPFYTDGPDDEQPERMLLLADLLESGLHPRIEPKQAKSYAKQLRDAAADLEKSLQTFWQPRIRLAMYGRMRTAAARNTQAALSRFKRLLRAQDVSEPDIHTIIPDRPAPVKKPEAPKEPPKDPLPPSA
ncbi:MAG: hypothetical protein JNJ46_32580 [Myxococcales bacterium]|nr:hypothetical protein [Myxococcales bacterium]